MTRRHSTYSDCELCGREAVNRHHVFMGTANRKKSEYWGMVANLCYDCHALIHADYTARVALCQRYQKQFEEQHNHELFMVEFGRNYL